ncbi:hypothetical protein HYV49_06170 [Candidatus Pacearchaeota archaeon]|nr:hypothetical protein [Candidatus Pacearchaeota archaeon]
MKKLKPSMRENRRYLLISGQGSIEKIFEQSVLNFLGELGYAQATPILIKRLKDSIIISVKREHVNQVRAAVCLSKGLMVKNASGTLKGLMKKIN